MKYLKGYKSFNEEAEFKVDAMDPANSANTKSIEAINKVSANIDEYNKLKTSISTIYKTSKNDTEVASRMKSLLGTKKGKENPFLLNYITVVSDERKVRDMVDSRVENKLKIDEYKELISMSENPSQKASMQAEVDKLTKKISTDDASLSKLKSDIEKRKKDIKTNISEIEKSMQRDIKNIS